MTYAAVDIVFLLLIVLFAVAAGIRGFIDEFFGKAAFFGGILAAVIFMPLLRPHVQAVIRNTAAAKVISFVVIFTLVFLFIKILQMILGKLFSGDILSSLNHSLGIMFGVVEGIVTVVFLIGLIESQPWVNPAPLLRGSFFASILDGIIAGPAQKIQGMAA